MNKKYIIILLVVFLLLTAGVAVFLRLGGQESYKKDSVAKPDMELVKVPTIQLEAVVVSLNLSNPAENSENALAPKDSGIIKINKIIAIDNPNNWNLEGIKEGNEIPVQFDYSARPTKIRIIPLVKNTNASNSAEASVSSMPAAFTMENGYFIYSNKSTLVDKERETILPGLNTGSKFTAVINYSSSNRIFVGEYKIMPL